MGKFDKIIILIIIINIILFIYLYFNYNKELNKISSNNKDVPPFEIAIFPTEEEIIQANEGVVYIKNMSYITEVYTSQKPIAKVSVKIEDTINTILNPAISQIDKIDEFFENNKSIIEDYCSINTIQEFKCLINKITNQQNSQIKEAEIKKDSVSIMKDIIKAQITFTLQDNTEIDINVDIEQNKLEIKMYV